MYCLLETNSRGGIFEIVVAYYVVLLLCIVNLGRFSQLVSTDRGFLPSQEGCTLEMFPGQLS